ncbi:hypothetical protein M422DRAFT_196528 [Sphaerobolus stellatus SS14]|uniref:PLAC8-domain-containing protein n=1 Tax=Sphaerobolus stellatus (strain SS14) TaxID=990650 RepID=A0A0C9TM82_SPHS4|nr:hypothetical protein M422DRAFT_196528 [Sphaerobolus stellatus SS14]
MNAGGNRNALGKPFDKDGKREWSHDFFDCFGDVGTCCLAYFLPCVAYGQNRSRLRHLQDKGTPHPHGGDSCTGACCGHACLLYCGFYWILQMNLRGEVRRRYNIDGGGCGDCMAALCCHPCELTQDSREIELEERSLMGGKGY